MSLFTEPVDRFFVGKLLSGVLFVASFFKLLVAVITALVPPYGIEQPWAASVLGYGLSCLLWFGEFRVVEGRRRASAARQELRAT